MKVAQLHYTSCKGGLGAGLGFQIRALSAGMDPEVKRQVLERCAYVPPDGMPAEPDDAQLDAFPVVLQLDRLQTGQLVLLRQAYTGRDYSGRWGNYFSHALVLERWPAHVWPMDVLDAAFWVQALDHDDGTSPPPLPALDLSDPGEPSFTWEDLQDLMAENPAHATRLANTLQGLLESDATDRSLVITGPWDDALLWLAALQRCLPPRLAAEIPFTTYAWDLRGAGRARVVPSVAKPRIGARERDHQFVVLDLATGADSQPVAPLGTFSTRATALLASDADRLLALHEQIEAWQAPLDAAALDEIVFWWELPLLEHDAAAVLEQAALRLQAIQEPEAVRRSVNALNTALHGAQQDLGAADLDPILDALRGCPQPAAAAALALAWKLRAVRALQGAPAAQLLPLLSRALPDPAPARAFLRTATQALRAHGTCTHDAARLLLGIGGTAGAPSDLDLALDALADVTRDVALASFVLSILPDASTKLRYLELLLHDDAGPRSPAVQALALAHVADPLASEGLLEELRLGGHGPAWRATIQVILRQSPSNDRTWSWVRRSVLSHEPERVVELAQQLLDQGGPGVDGLILTWLESGVLDRLPTPRRTAALSQLALRVPLDPRDDTDAPLVARLAQAGVQLPAPDRLFLRRALTLLARGGRLDDVPDPAGGWRAHLDALDEPQRVLVGDRLVAALIADPSVSLGDMMMSLEQVGSTPDALGRWAANPRHDVLRAWGLVLREPRQCKPLDDALVERCAAMDRRDWEALRERLEELHGRRRTWTLLRDRVESRRKASGGLFKKLFGG